MIFFILREGLDLMLGSAQTVFMSEYIYCRDTQSENGSVTDLQLLQGEERVEGGASFP